MLMGSTNPRRSASAEVKAAAARPEMAQAKAVALTAVVAPESEEAAVAALVVMVAAVVATAESTEAAMVR